MSIAFENGWPGVFAGVVIVRLHRFFLMMVIIFFVRNGHWIRSRYWDWPIYKNTNRVWYVFFNGHVNRIRSIDGYFDRVWNVFFNVHGIRLRYRNWYPMFNGYAYFVRHVFFYGNRIGMRYLYVNGIGNLFLDMNVIRYGYFFGDGDFFNVRV